MSERKFSNRKRSQRFKPSSGGRKGGGGGGGGGRGGNRDNSAKARRQAQNARALATGEKSAEEKVFNASRENEITRAENVAAGLPPEGEKPKKAEVKPPPEAVEDPKKKKNFEPVEIKEETKGIVDKIKKTASKMIKKVKKLVSDQPKIHKEVIINYESLETRVAVQENGKLEEFNIERTDMERMAGSIYKGKIKNLEDGLKAAFVDIGYEKNAFLHYWDIIPSNLDSSVEVIDRGDQKKVDASAARNAPRSRRRTFRNSTREARRSSSRFPRAPSAPRDRASPHTSPSPAATWCSCPTPISAASPVRSTVRKNASA